MKRSFESEHYNSRSAIRGELVVQLARKCTLAVLALNIVVHYFGTPYRMTSETLT